MRAGELKLTPQGIAEIEGTMTGTRTHGKPPRKPRLAPGHLEKYSLVAGRSAIEVASDVIALLFCRLKWRPATPMLFRQ
jgi:hypothetical protein